MEAVEIVKHYFQSVYHKRDKEATNEESLEGFKWKQQKYIFAELNYRYRLIMADLDYPVNKHRRLEDKAFLPDLAIRCKSYAVILIEHAEELGIFENKEDRMNLISFFTNLG